MMKRILCSKVQKRVYVYITDGTQSYPKRAELRLPSINFHKKIVKADKNQIVWLKKR